MHLLPTLTEALERAVTTVPGPVHCTIGPATAWFSGGRVLQIPASGLEGVAEAVRQATVPIIPDAGEAPFVGHLTVGARARTPGRPVHSGGRGRNCLHGSVRCAAPLARRLSAVRPGVPATRRWRNSHFPRDRKEARGVRVARCTAPLSRPPRYRE